MAVLDWEFAHDGDPIEDLAWAEWIVRAHHADAVRYLPALFDGYGRRPLWSLRQAAMCTRCAEYQEMCLQSGDVTAAEVWQTRERLTRQWHE